MYFKKLGFFHCCIVLICTRCEKFSFSETVMHKHIYKFILHSNIIQNSLPYFLSNNPQPFPPSTPLQPPSHPLSTPSLLLAGTPSPPSNHRPRTIKRKNIKIRKIKIFRIGRSNLFYYGMYFICRYSCQSLLSIMLML